MKMSINNTWDNFTREDLLECARRSDISKPNEIIEQVKEAVASWSTIATDWRDQ